MRKRSLSALFICMLARMPFASADVILTRTTSCGGPNGYRTVVVHDGLFGNMGTYMVHCQDPGKNPCPFLPDLDFGHAWLERIVTGLLQEVYPLAANAQPVGKIQRVYADPESGKLYVFTVTWNLTDPLNSSLSIDKTEIGE